MTDCMVAGSKVWCLPEVGQLPMRKQLNYEMRCVVCCPSYGPHGGSCILPAAQKNKFAVGPAERAPATSGCLRPCFTGAQEADWPCKLASGYHVAVEQAAEAPLAVQPVSESIKALSVLPKAREDAHFAGPDEASPRMITKAVSKDITSC